MIFTSITGKLLLDVAVVPDVSGAAPYFILMAVGCGIALIAGVVLLLYFLVFKNKKKK